LDKALGQDQRTNTNVEISNDIEDKANEKNRSIKPNRQTTQDWLSKLQHQYGGAVVAELLQEP
jgi:hypothetical protein